MRLDQLYHSLLLKYGYQGWWPITGVGYHPKDYSFPRNDRERFEICVGAILTQNTSWTNVEKALNNLHNNNLLSPEKIVKIDRAELSKLIKPAGYYNQKARYLQNFATFFLEHRGIPSREELLSIKGIGKETADSILLYGYNVPTFVVDAYTKRIFKREGILDSNNYDEVKEYVEKRLKKDYKIYQEFHALLVQHGKVLNSL